MEPTPEGCHARYHADIYKKANLTGSSDVQNDKLFYRAIHLSVHLYFKMAWIKLLEQY